MKKNISNKTKISIARIVIIMILSLILVSSLYMINKDDDTPPEPTPIVTETPTPTPPIVTETITKTSSYMIDTSKTPEPTPEPSPEPVKKKKPKNTPPKLKNIPLDKDLKNFIYKKCKYDDDLYCLVMAVIKTESDFQEDAVSYDGHDHGLMQLRDYYYDAWMEYFRVSDPTKAYDNVTIGIGLLSGFLELYEEKHLALMCYNCGEYEARQLWEQGIYSTEYSRKVIGHYEKLKMEVEK